MHNVRFLNICTDTHKEQCIAHILQKVRLLSFHQNRTVTPWSRLLKRA
jgi:hypothetical protein